MAFKNRQDSPATTASVISLIQRSVKIQQFMDGTVDGVNTIFTVPNGDSVFDSMIDIFDGGGKLTPGTDYTQNSLSQFTLANAPSTRPECTYLAIAS